jgi:hypothetical protein
VRALLVPRPLVLVALVAVMGAWTPAARASWSAPTTVSEPHDAIGGLQLASGSTADLLTWSYYDLVPPARQIFGAPGARYAVARSGGPFGPERRLPASYASAPMVNLGGGHVAQLILVRTSINTSRPEVALGDVHGSFGAPKRIPGASVENWQARLVGNARGELLFTCISAEADGYHRVVWASTRAPGGSFGPPQLVSYSSEAEHVTAAIGPQGDMLVAFASKWGRMLARVRRHGQRWGPLQNVGPAAGGNENDVTPFVAVHGRIILAWYETQLGEGGPYPGFTRVAVQPAGASRFRPQQVLERDNMGLSGALIGARPAPVVIAVDGRAPIVVFLAPGETQPTTSPTQLTTSPLEFPAVVKVAYPKGLGFSASQAISPAGRQAGDVAAAASPNGAIITWVAGTYETGSVSASWFLPATGLFGPPEQVSPSERVEIAVPTYSTSGDRWIIAWAGRPKYQSPMSPGPTLVRVSFCRGACR